MSLITTTKRGDQLLRWSDWVLLGLGIVAFPPLIVLTILFVMHFLNPYTNFISDINIRAGLKLFQAQVFAILWSPFLILPSVIISRWFLKHGWAGLLVAAGLPSVLAFLVFLSANEGELDKARQMKFTTSAALHGLAGWLTIGILRPAAIAPRGS